MLTPMKIDFTAPVGPKKFLRTRREELAALRFERIGVDQVGATLGAEISDVDLRQPLDDATFAEIERALLAFKVLFFRDQDLSPAQHAAFGRRFGDLEIHPFLPAPEGSPEVVLLAKNEDIGGYENAWHSDVTWRAAPSLGSILRCRECPPVGGDTLFADMAAAYRGLPKEVREYVDGKRAGARLHDHVRPHADAGGARREAEGVSRGVAPDRAHASRDGREVPLREPRLHEPRRRASIPTRAAACSRSSTSRRATPSTRCASAGGRTRSRSGTTGRRSTTRARTTGPDVRVMERVTVVGDRPY
jgi:taurine dioxygenase